MRRAILPATVALALAGAFAAALLAPRPTDLPAVALGAVVVWRAEIAAVIFVTAYAALVTARLSLHGHTFTRVGTAGVDIPQVGPAQAANAVELRQTVDALCAQIIALGDRLTALEDPTHPLLNPDEEGT